MTAVPVVSCPECGEPWVSSGYYQDATTYKCINGHRWAISKCLSSLPAQVKAEEVAASVAECGEDGLPSVDEDHLPQPTLASVVRGQGGQVFDVTDGSSVDSEGQREVHIMVEWMDGRPPWCAVLRSGQGGMWRWDDDNLVVRVSRRPHLRFEVPREAIRRVLVEHDAAMVSESHNERMARLADEFVERSVGNGVECSACLRRPPSHAENCPLWALLVEAKV